MQFSKKHAFNILENAIMNWKVEKNQLDNISQKNGRTKDIKRTKEQKRKKKITKVGKL